MITCEKTPLPRFQWQNYIQEATKEAMKTIPLTQNQFSIVDDHWYEYLMQWKWQALWMKSAKSYYAVRTESKKAILMHRVIMNTPDGMECDHRNHNTLDNRESELRNVTRSQNKMNGRVQANNKLRIKGVCKQTNYEAYKARLKFQGKIVLDKTFPTIEEAVSARQEAEKKYFGEFAYQEVS